MKKVINIEGHGQIIFMSIKPRDIKNPSKKNDVLHN